MSKIVAIEHLTLDGVMQGPARPDEDRRDGFEQGGWSQAAYDPAMQQVIGARMGSSWSLLTGRITYVDLHKVWTNRPPNPFTDALNAVEKFVASTTLTEPLPWQNSTLLKPDIPNAIKELKQRHEKTLVIFGSGVLIQSLMQHNLIDEFVLQIHPLVLGRGRRLFPPDGSSIKLNLVKSITTATGIVIGTWTVAR
jgi:dihydrofolate reductase